MMPAPFISVALVEDEAATRERLMSVISAEPNLDLQLAAPNGQAFIDWIRHHMVDVMLVDLGLPDIDGLDVIRSCRELQPLAAVMVLTMFADEAKIVAAFENGASGYLLKDGSEDQLGTHLRHLHEGGSPLSPIIARQLLLRWRLKSDAPPTAPQPGARETRAEPVRTGSKRTSTPTEPLTRREQEVLELVARGFTYVEVASLLGIGVPTVRTFVRGVYAKLRVHTKTEAVFEARHQGLLP